MADISSTASTTSSTSSSSTAGTVSNGRYWGLASGLDVDSIVKGLLGTQQEKIDKTKGKVQTLQWQQTAYQGITTQMQTFEKAYLQLGSSTSMASSSMYLAYAATSDQPSIITATAGSGTTGDAQKVVITQSATSAKISGGQASSNISGNVDIGGAGLEALKSQATAADAAGLADPSFNVTVDGVSKTIAFTSSDLSGVNDSAGMVSLINQKLSDSFGQVPEINTDGTVKKDSSNNPIMDPKVLASVDGSGNLQLTAGGSYQSVISISASSQSFDTRLLSGEAQAAGSLGSTNPSLSLTYNGASQSINFTSADDLSPANIQSTIQTKIDTAFGAGNLTVAVDSTTGSLKISKADGTAVSYTTANTTFNALGGLGLTSGQSNRLDTSNTTLQQLFASKVPPIALNTGSDGDLHVNINGQDVNVGLPGASISSALNAINTSKAGVTASYNSSTDTMSVTSTQSGNAGSVDLSSDTSGFFSALGMTEAQTASKATGGDAIVTVNGDSYTRPTNNFTINGVSYNINSVVTTPTTANVSLTPNTTTLSTGINNFISAYNTMITSVYSQIDTQPSSSYPPLTTAQTATMTTDQITQYNTDAQQGMLYGDNTLTGILDSLRSALYQPVTTTGGKSVSLFDFGITTSDDPDAHGALEIKPADQQKFQDALANNSSEINDFFTTQSTISLSINPQSSFATSQQQQRTQQEGLVDRFDDIIQGATATVGGTAGSLLNLAGEVGDPTQYSNSINTQITDLNASVTTYTTEMTDQQNRLYTEFENLETYMDQANSQSATLTAMTS